MSKDLFQVLADELTLVRHDIAKLQRTSLDKEEAEALHAIVAKAIKDMRQATAEAPQALQKTLKADRDRMARDAAQAAREAAERVMGEIRGQLQAERLHFAQSAGEARRAAWRSFGGFWVWLLSMLATGALMGALGAFWIMGEDNAKAFGRYPSLHCTGAGGEVLANDSGREACVFWYD